MIRVAITTLDGVDFEFFARTTFDDLHAILCRRKNDEGIFIQTCSDVREVVHFGSEVLKKSSVIVEELPEEELSEGD